MVEKRPKPDWGDKGQKKKGKRKRYPTQWERKEPKIAAEAIVSAAESLKKIADRELSKEEEQDPCNGPPKLFSSLTYAQRQILSAFVVTGRLTEAIRVTGYNPWIHHLSMQKSETYRKLYHLARKVAGEVMESEAVRRANEGLRRYKFYKGDPIIDPTTGEPYYELEYSDRLLLALLKSFKPEQYKERKEVQHKGGDTPQQGEGIVDVLAKRAALLAGAETQPGGNGEHHGGNGNGSDDK